MAETEQNARASFFIFFPNTICPFNYNTNMRKLFFRLIIVGIRNIFAGICIILSLDFQKSDMDYVIDGSEPISDA